MRAFIVAIGVVGCTPDYGPPSESTVIIWHASGGVVSWSNVAIFGTEVRYGEEGSLTHVGQITLPAVGAIIHAVEDYDFLDREPGSFNDTGRKCVLLGHASSTITVRLTAGENSIDYRCPDELIYLGQRMGDLSGFDAWDRQP